MRYLGASAAGLVAAMTISLIPLGQAALAAEGKPVAVSKLGMNTILPLATTLSFAIARYGKPTFLDGWAEYQDAPTCKFLSSGEWTQNPPTQNCDPDPKGTMKCGKVSYGVSKPEPLPDGPCTGLLVQYGEIFYVWNAHNNQSTLSGPPNMVNDTFNATWKSKDFNEGPYTFNIHVPVVRPVGEVTAATGWAAAPKQTSVTFAQTLRPPSTDKDFDFKGEIVQETIGKGAGGPDTCYFDGSAYAKQLTITLGPGATVTSGNVWKSDTVGWNPPAVDYYRTHPPLNVRAPCGTTFRQQMQIHAPSDPAKSYTDYGAVNVLNLLIGKVTVTGTRNGVSCTRDWPGAISKCPN